MFRSSYLLTLLLISAAFSSANAHYGAKYEPPDGKTYHGVGWHNPSQIEYGEMFPDSLQPILHQFMAPLPGSAQRGGMRVDNLLRGFEPDHIDVENQYCELSVHFTDNTIMLDTTFALTRELDGYIDTLAIAIRTHGRPVFLRIGLEMNGAWNGYTPWIFPQAFRKLVEGIRERDVDNFATVWCYEPDAPDDFADSTRQGWKWYPGDDVVDWFGLDPFDVDHFDPAEPDSIQRGERWYLSKKGKTEKFLRFADQRGKPVYLNELTARKVWITPYDEDVDSTHGEVDWQHWFEPFFEFMDSHPNIKALNYINLDWTQYDRWEHWGDARLQINEYIRDHWVEELSGERFIHTGFSIEDLESVSERVQFIPNEFGLSVYPNPFNSVLNIRYYLANPGLVSLIVYDLQGRPVGTMHNSQQVRGYNSFSWNAGSLASGLYWVRLQTERAQTSARVILMK